MALAHTLPDGVGAKYRRALRQTLVERWPRLPAGVGWGGLIGLSALWGYLTVRALVIRSAVVAYESVNGSALDHYRNGRTTGWETFETFRNSLNGLVESSGLLGGFEYAYFVFFPVAPIVLYGGWLGFSRLATRTRPQARRHLMVAATAILVVQLVFLTQPISVFSELTN